MRKKLMVCVALTGVGTSKEQTPHVPITPQEIADDAIACVKAGASIVHLHARDDNAKNTMDTEKFAEIVSLIRAKLEAEDLDVIINITTSGSSFPDDTRMAHLAALQPEMCSFDPGTMNWANKYVFENKPAFLEKLGEECIKTGVKPEIEIFDAGMVGNTHYYLKNGFLKAPLHCQFVLGVPGGMPANIESLSYLLPKIPQGSTWSVTGIGRSARPMMLAGLAADCDGIRVGLEDNIFIEKGVLATNVELVEDAVQLGIAAKRDIATAAEAREILGLTKK
ncbi:3-keto-5-aminohexanoate cleavage protein [Photobacterium sp. DNB23_23_1]